ncbi:hypothetical protein [Hydrogenophaga sp.]|uniref:hypothetical protein n=1 Tax=Hydrogenophaga sp. TaxID=1904254 RepID=UPI003D13A239
MAEASKGRGSVTDSDFILSDRDALQKRAHEGAFFLRVAGHHHVAHHLYSEGRLDARDLLPHRGVFEQLEAGLNRADL